MPTLERLVPADADSLAALGELASTASRPTPAPATRDEQLTVAVPRADARGWRSARRDLLAGLPASLPLLRSPSTVPAVAAVRALPRRTQLLALAATSVAAGLLAGLVVPVAAAAPSPTASATGQRSATAATGATSTSHEAAGTRTVAARPATASSRPARNAAAAAPSRPVQARSTATRPVGATALAAALPTLASATSIDWTTAARATARPGSGRPAASVAATAAAAARENAPSRPSPQTVAAARAYKPTVRLPAASGTGRRIVYAQHRGHLWIVGADGRVVRDYPVTGRIGRPAPGTYTVFSKSRTAVNPAAKVRFDLMVRFAHGITGAPIGFHTIPRWYDGRPLQKVSQLGQMIGAGGCVRQALADARWLYRWASVGERVVVLH